MNDLEAKLWVDVYVLQSDKNYSSRGYPGSYQPPEMIADEAVEALRQRMADELPGELSGSCNNGFHRCDHRQRKSCVDWMPNDAKKVL